MNTQEFCVMGLLWQLPYYLHLAVCFCFLPGLLSDSFFDTLRNGLNSLTSLF